MENIFKVGDEVYDYYHHWGVIKNIKEEYLKIKFNNFNIFITFYKNHNHINSINRLSFTEYDFINGGFSQVRPINFKEGDIGYFWDKDSEYIRYGKLQTINLNEKYCYFSIDCAFENFSLTPPEIL